MDKQQDNRMTWEEFFKLHPEYVKKEKPIKKNRFRFLCQCKTGHVFDYRERERYSMDNPHFAPCQGKCPICGCSEFSFIGNSASIYPIKMNFTG